MSRTGDFEVVRDPLWNNIRIDREALGVLDTEPLQRLRYIRQLGHAYLVYPGATHSRFEHALGTYHLARRALGLLAERGELDGVSPHDLTAVRLGALLHDVGHYPFSHALEEAGLPSHEQLAVQRLQHPEILSSLRSCGLEDPGAIATLIGGSSPNSLQGLISGSLDLDKIEYLTRDARMCGVPYGTVDVDRLLHSLTVVPMPDGRRTIGVHEKGLSALESLLFAKYQMYRNVYWHHAVRSATAMFKRVVRQAIHDGIVDAAIIPTTTDEQLMESLRRVTGSDLRDRLRSRQLYKRAIDMPSESFPVSHTTWIATDPDLTQAVEDRLAEQFGLRSGELLLDYPAKPAMLSVDLPVLTRDGRVEPLSGERGTALLGIQRVANVLRGIAQRLRVFVARPVTIPPSVVARLVEEPAESIREALRRGDVLASTS